MDNSDSEGATCSTEIENLASILQSSLLVDEFRKICAPVSNVDSSKKQENMRNILKYAINLKSHSETNLMKKLQTDGKSKSSKLEVSKITSMQNMSDIVAREPKTIQELKKDLDILNDAINALTVVLGNDTKDHEVSNTQTLQLLGNKLDKHQHMLDELILRSFKDRADEVIQFFGELLRTHFSDCNDYMSMEGKEKSQDILESLLEYGIIETHLEDSSKIRLKNNF